MSIVYENKVSKTDIPFKQELYRKGIHLISLSIPIGYIFVDQQTALYILIPLAIIAVVIDVMSKRNNVIHHLLYGYFGKILRPHERKKFVLNGASWVLISASICVWIFPKIVMITAFSILIISDIAAALIGKRFGSVPFLDKSLAGTSAFIISAIIVCTIIGTFTNAPATYYIASYVSSVIGGIVEASSRRLKVDDNLSIPMSVGLVLLLAAWIFQFNGTQSFLNLL